MARTKKQVLQATARKQQLHQQAYERAAREAAQDPSAGPSPAPSPRKGQTDVSSIATSDPIGKQQDASDHPAASRQPKTIPVPRKLKQSDGVNVPNVNHDLYKKSVSPPKKGVEQANSDKPEIYIDVDLDGQEVSPHSSPVAAPVSFKKTKLTARKSTNAVKKAEAREILETLSKVDSDGKTKGKAKKLSPVKVKAQVKNNKKDSPQKKSPKKLVTARKSTSASVHCKIARTSPRGPQKKHIFAKKTFQSTPLSQELLGDDVAAANAEDPESLTVFQNVQEAVITLPKSQKLPMALVCISDICKDSDAPETEDGEKKDILKEPELAELPKGANKKESPKQTEKKESPRGRKANRPQSPRRSGEKAKSPRRSPKGERRSKNIFEQFQNEISEDESPRTKKLAKSPNNKGSNKKVASTTFASAMKVLRSVSEKVDGRRKKPFTPSPRKKSPRRNSLTLEIPKPNSSAASKTPSPSKSPENKTKRRSGSASPRAGSPRVNKKIKSPSIKPQEDNVMYMSLVKKGKISPKSGKQELMLTVQKEPELKEDGSHIEESHSADMESGSVKQETCSDKKDTCLKNKKSDEDSAQKLKAVRELDFMAHCSEQIVKNLTEETSGEDGSPSVEQSTSLKSDSSQPKPGTSESAESSQDGMSKSQKQKELQDLISKVGSSIKTSLFPTLEASQFPEEEESEPSSLNTSHNSDSFSEMLDQMEPGSSLSDPKVVEGEPGGSSEQETDSVPPDVKCGELYRRLIGDVKDTPVPGPSDVKKSESQTPVKDNVKERVSDVKTQESTSSPDKNESCLLKQHLLSEIKPKIDSSQIQPVIVLDDKTEVLAKPTSSLDTDVTVKKEDTSDGKRVPGWRKMYKTKEPLPLDILSKAEKVSNVDKKSAFVSDELENYLESSKSLNLKSQGHSDVTTDSSPEGKDISSDLKDIEPDFDEVEGVLFLSFSSKDAMDAHMAVEKKNKWDKDANHLLGVSRLLEFEKEKEQVVEGESPDQVKKAHTQNLRGQHMKWRKYKRMLKEEFENLKIYREKGEFYSVIRTPEKTSDITKIKGWKNKFMDKQDPDSQKLHWRTEERLLKNLEPDDIKALGIKKKRRKNVVFTHRKGSSKEIGYSAGRTSTFGQSGSPEDGDWDVLMGDYEEPLYENNGEDELEHSDEEMKQIDWGAQDSSLNTSEDVVGPFGHARKIQVRKEFATLFKWSEDDLRIMKILGGRVRNRRKKNDPTDMTSLLAESDSPDLRKSFRRKMKLKRTDYIPVSIITEKMAIDATCALDFGKYKPTRPGSGVSDNILPKSPKKIQTSTMAGMKLLKKGKALLRAQKEKKLKSLAPNGNEYVIMRRRNPSCEAPNGDDDDDRDKRSCDKKGCRYGCICHLCNDHADDVEVSDSVLHTCDKEYCRLGCICDSLVVHGGGTDGHCRKPECMIECVCPKPQTHAGATHHDESSDEIPSLIKDSDVSPDGTPLDGDKDKEDYRPNKTWSRNAKGDKYSNLPRRESRHRVSKNLDAITRKAMMVYEASEMYCEQSGRRRKHSDEPIPVQKIPAPVQKHPPPFQKHPAPAQKHPAPKSVSPPQKLSKGPTGNRIPKKRIIPQAEDAIQISDDEDVVDTTTCARLQFYHTKTTEKDLSSDPTVVHISHSGGESGTSSVNISPGSSRPPSPFDNKPDFEQVSKMTSVVKNNVEAQKPQHIEPLKKKIQRILPADSVVPTAWHTQMVCLKANPKPKDGETEEPEPEQEGEEIKLLEFMANCNWDNAKPLILSRVAQCLSRGVYPEPRRMIIGEYIVEIMPKADKCAVIPTELRDKLPNGMYSIRVKVMRKALEKDLNRYQLTAAIAAAKIKQHRASLKQPKDSVSGQSCDSASRRVFQNSSSSSIDVNRKIAKNMTNTVNNTNTVTPVSTSVTTSSSPMGISGLSRLQISHPPMNAKSKVVDSNKTEMTNLSNINSVNKSSHLEIEQITVKSNEAGDTVATIRIDNKKDDEPPRKKTKTASLSSDCKIIKATTSSSKSIDKLGKIPLDGHWDGDISNIISSDEPENRNGTSHSGDMIDLTNENPGSKSENANGDSENVIDPKQASSNLPPGAVKAGNNGGMVSLLKNKTAPVYFKPANVPAVPSAPPQFFLPVRTPAPGTKFILAGGALASGALAGAGAPNVPLPSVGPRPTKTIISTPGGKLYGPFNDLNDVKMFQVKGPDGVSQPLIKLLPANALPPVKPVITDAKSPTASTVSVHEGDHNGVNLTGKNRTVRKTNSGNHGNAKMLNNDNCDQIGAYSFSQTPGRVIRADKENIDGDFEHFEYGPFIRTNVEGNKLSSQIPPRRFSQSAISTGQGGNSQVQSLDLHSLKTSSPVSFVHKASHGFIPIKRQRSDSDSAAYVDVSKRIKLVEHRQSPETVGISQRLTPAQQFRERLNMQVIDISDDDSQMSNSSGHSVQNLYTVQQSEEEDLDVENVQFSVPPPPPVDARSALIKQLQEAGISVDLDKHTEVRAIKKVREKARRQDILCMFMYLYNTIDQGEDTSESALSRQKVLDAALETIEYEKKRYKELGEQLRIEVFSNRAHHRRLRNSVDEMIKDGIDATKILAHLKAVKQKEEKRLSKKRLLRKIIEYGRLQKEKEGKVKSSQSSRFLFGTTKAPPKAKETPVVEPEASESGPCAIDKLRANKKVIANPENPSQYWSENFLIEIEVDEEEDGESQDGDVKKEEDEDSDQENDEKVKREEDSSQENILYVTIENRDLVEDERDITPDEPRETTEKCRADTVTHSGISDSMQNSPEIEEKDDIGKNVENDDFPESVEKCESPGSGEKCDSQEYADEIDSLDNGAQEDSSKGVKCDSPENEASMEIEEKTDSEEIGEKDYSPEIVEESVNLREERTNESEHGTLKRSNSEEAILQVESFIENSELWGRTSISEENDVNSSESCDKNCENVSESVNESVPEKKPIVNPERRDSAESVKSAESVGIKSDSDKEKSSESGESIFLPFELNFDDASVDSVPLEPKNSDTVADDKEGSSEGSEKMDGKEDKSFLISDIRGLAQDEFFCAR